MTMAKHLIGLEASAYEHPFDRKALAALKAIPALDSILNTVLNWSEIKWEVTRLQGSAFRVTQDSCPGLYKLVREAARRIDVRDFPKIYTEWGYFINAYTAGYDKDTLLVIYSGAADILSDDELTYVIGHELGHIKSDHCLYHYVASKIGQAAASVPGGSVLIAPIIYSLMYWYRMSEFTADRAGLLACQDIDVALGAIIKMSGLPSKYFEHMNREAFLEQAREFEKEFNALSDKAIKAISIMDETHPWTILRAAELIKWYESDEYRQILDSVVLHDCGNWIPAASPRCPFCARPVE